MKKIYRFVFAAALVLLFAGVFTGAAAAADTMFTGSADKAVYSGLSHSQSEIDQAKAEYDDACSRYAAAVDAYDKAKNEYKEARKSHDGAKIREALRKVDNTVEKFKAARVAKNLAEEKLAKAREPGAPRFLTLLTSLLM